MSEASRAYFTYLELPESISGRGHRNALTIVVFVVAFVEVTTAEMVEVKAVCARLRDDDVEKYDVCKEDHGPWEAADDTKTSKGWWVDDCGLWTVESGKQKKSTF